MDESLASELADWLNNTSDEYVVNRTLKSTPDEVTEVVYLRDRQGDPSIGPFVRKRFLEESQRGYAYEHIFRAQTQGHHLQHQPLLYSCRREGAFYEVVMEYIPGTTLRDLVTQRGPSVELARRVMPALCDAVSELHESFEKPIIHRDVKPSNVMLLNDRLLLIDLGIARTYQAGASHDTVRYGTPGYAPPEQFGYGQTSTRSDVYALGMTLAYCLTGEEPTPQLRQKAFNDPRIPPVLQEVLVHATEFDPNRRHPSARALRNDFEHAVGASQPGSVQPQQEETTGSFWGQVKQGQRLVAIGRIWNVLLAIVWAAIAIACAVNIVQPREGQTIYPLWFRLIEFTGVVLVPWTAVSYALADKRRLRKREPFRGFLWWVELLVCVGITLASMLIATVIHMALFGQSPS